MMKFTQFMAKMDAHKRAGNRITKYNHGKGESSYTVVTPEGITTKVKHTDSGVKVSHKNNNKEK